jgi:hypothetical protein
MTAMSFDDHHTAMPARAWVGPRPVAVADYPKAAEPSHINDRSR